MREDVCVELGNLAEWATVLATLVVAYVAWRVGRQAKGIKEEVKETTEAIMATQGNWAVPSPDRWRPRGNIQVGGIAKRVPLYVYIGDGDAATDAERDGLDTPHGICPDWGNPYSASEPVWIVKADLETADPTSLP